MEFAHGGSLSSLLQQRNSGLYPSVFIEYAKQIAEGMKYLHEEACEHIIHRDLKASNGNFDFPLSKVKSYEISSMNHNLVLILEPINNVLDDDDLLKKTLKITDFGLAKNQLQSSKVSAAGTSAWMSPECIRDNEFSTKSDVWR